MRSTTMVHYCRADIQNFDESLLHTDYVTAKPKHAIDDVIPVDGGTWRVTAKVDNRSFREMVFYVLPYDDEDFWD